MRPLLNLLLASLLASASATTSSIALRTTDTRPPDGCTGPRPRWGTSLCWYNVERSPLLTNVTWLHVPKCGSSFARLVFRGACGAVPANKTHVDFVEASAMHPIIQLHCKSAFHRFQSWHAALSPSEASRCGRGLVCVTTLRTTWKRVESGFHHNLHDCQWMQDAHRLNQDYGPKSGRPSFYKTYTEDHVRLYASCVSTCMTRMLTGLPCGRCSGTLSRAQAARCVERVWSDAFSGIEASAGEGGTAALNISDYVRFASRTRSKRADPLHDPDPPPDTRRAMRTLSRFAFVGLLDNWSWTVHQFGRRFGVPLLPSDYKVLRAGSKSRSSSPRQKMAEQTLRAFSFAADDALVSATSDSLGVHRRLQSQQTQMRIAWLEIPHYSEGYYDALQQPLSRLGHRVDELRAPTQRGFGPGVLATKLRGMDIAVVGFGWFPQEPGSGPFTRLHEFQRSCAASHRVRLEAAGEFESTTRRACLCGTVPLVVILNKEYASLADKMAWVREHCVAAAFSVHHDAPTFAQMTGVDFHHIPFGVDFSRFARGQRAEAGRAVSDGYAYDLGFTGVIRPDQTANWRYRIWRSAWPILAERGLRLYSGGEGGVGLGRRHKSVGPKEYVAKMQASKVWLATTGPADLVGTRYSEIMATGTTLCVCNRLHGNATAAYARLGLVEGRHVVMFDSLEEFVEVVTNYTRRPEYERRRLAIIRRAQALARRRLSWRQVAASVDAVLQGVARGGRGALRERRTTGRRGGGGDKASGGGAGGGGVEGGGGGVGPFGGNALVLRCCMQIRVFRCLCSPRTQARRRLHRTAPHTGPTLVCVEDAGSRAGGVRRLAR